MVRTDLSIEGRIMLALGRAKVPVALFDWNYVPQLDEWQLVIATPWYETRGPRESNIKIIAVLEKAGIYKDVPIRRVVIKGLGDSLVKALTQEIQTSTEGVVFIDASRKKTDTKDFSLAFAPFTGPGGAIPLLHFDRDEGLQDFLKNRLHLGRSLVEEAMRELSLQGHTFIPNVPLTRKQAKGLGLS